MTGVGSRAEGPPGHFWSLRLPLPRAGARADPLSTPPLILQGRHASNLHTEKLKAQKGYLTCLWSFTWWRLELNLNPGLDPKFVLFHFMGPLLCFLCDQNVSSLP